MARTEAELSDERVELGPLMYQIWCHGSRSNDVDELIMTLKTVHGVKGATRQEVIDGYFIAVKIDQEYVAEQVVARVGQIVFGWANKRQLAVAKNAD